MSPAADGELRLRHPGGTTRLFVGRGALDAARPHLERWLSGRQAFLISSEPVLERADRACAAVERLAGELVVLRVPDGEAAKSVEVAESLWNRMLEAGGRRDSVAVALGGGSVGDVAGFAAATFLRGIELALLPTTLLAQVDAAVGGKTAIDLPAAKNSVGAFWHPRWVVADLDLLGGLPAGELRAGMVEVVKIAAAADATLLERLEERMTAALSGDQEALEGIVRDAVATKIRVVEADPDEGDSRRVLNLGHTLGHAIEAALGYRGLRHGEAVAYGLLFALRLATERGADPSFAARLAGLLERLEPPPLPELGRAALLEAIEKDKKARRGGVVWMLPTGPGAVEPVTDLDPAWFDEQLAAFLEDPWAGLHEPPRAVR